MSGGQIYSLDNPLLREPLKPEHVFVVEAHEVEWLVDALVDNPFQWMVQEAFDAWRPLVEGQPRIARERFFWERGPEA